MYKKPRDNEQFLNYGYPIEIINYGGQQFTRRDTVRARELYFFMPEMNEGIFQTNHVEIL
jgi:hypothetical protein